MTNAVLAVLAAERRAQIRRDFAGARRFALRRRIAHAVYAVAFRFVALAVALDDEAGTLRA